ncbi:hypothetical protein D3C86_1153390 [compost metagenome]
MQTKISGSYHRSDFQALSRDPGIELKDQAVDIRCHVYVVTKSDNCVGFICIVETQPEKSSVSGPIRSESVIITVCGRKTGYITYPDVCPLGIGVSVSSALKMTQAVVPGGGSINDPVIALRTQAVRGEIN